MNKFNQLVESVLTEAKPDKKLQDVVKVWLAAEEDGFEVFFRGEKIGDNISGFDKDVLKSKAKELGIKMRIPGRKNVSDLIATALGKEVYFDGADLVSDDEVILSDVLVPGNTHSTLSYIIQNAK